MMLDIRYFNSLDATAHSNDNVLVGYQDDKPLGKHPQTILQPTVAKLLADYNISGVILFSENLVNQQQIRTLTTDIDKVAAHSSSQNKLLISIDQEGGRVARLPRVTFPTFTGNMAIGALPDNNQQWSFKVGEAIGQQLSSLGINVNHAPTIDVNCNPNNPVINVRSFSDNPQQVAELGCAMSKGLMAANVLPTVKHFPGHGDTNVDSHTGLPQVNHDLITVHKVDLHPFVQAIKQNCAPMIMTAHIQYPALDKSVIKGKNGDIFIRPATLSPTILTSLLREELKYEGVVITDALDMASISHYLTPTEAVIETFKAGADIALMPFKVHKPSDVAAFDEFFSDIVLKISKDNDLYDKVLKSYARVSSMKNTYLSCAHDTTLVQLKAHLELESKIAQHSIINHSGMNTLDWKAINTIVTVFPTKEQGNALQYSLKLSPFISQSLFFDNITLDEFVNIQHPENTLLIIGIEDVKSAVDLGGADDLSKCLLQPHSMNPNNVLSYLKNHNELGGQSVFICLKAPYNLDQYICNSTLALTSFDGSVYQNNEGNWMGPSFSAISKIITNEVRADGVMPIVNC